MLQNCKCDVRSNNQLLSKAEKLRGGYNCAKPNWDDLKLVEVVPSFSSCISVNTRRDTVAQRADGANRRVLVANSALKLRPVLLLAAQSRMCDGRRAENATHHVISSDRCPCIVPGSKRLVQSSGKRHVQNLGRLNSRLVLCHNCPNFLQTSLHGYITSRHITKLWLTSNQNGFRAPRSS